MAHPTIISSILLFIFSLGSDALRTLCMAWTNKSSALVLESKPLAFPTGVLFASII